MVFLDVSFLLLASPFLGMCGHAQWGGLIELDEADVKLIFCINMKHFTGLLNPRDCDNGDS